MRNEDFRVRGASERRRVAGRAMRMWDRRLALSAGLMMCAGAMAQTPPNTQPPLDVNRIQPPPASTPAPKPEAAKPAEPPASDAAKTGEPVKPDAKPDAKADEAKPDEAKKSAEAVPPTVAVAEKALPPIPQSADAKADGLRYPVSRFVIEYRSEHAVHPPVEELQEARAKLAATSDGYVATKLQGFAGERNELDTVEIRVGDIMEGSGGVFYRSGIGAVSAAIVRALNDRGVVGVFIQLHPEDIDEVTGKDKRDGKRSELRLIVWTGVISQVRTIASGERLGLDDAADSALRVNNDDAVHARIREQSPVQQGDLIHKDAMDDFVFRLNRHPSRRVDIAIAPGANPEQVVLDYLVSEGKPWSVYGQISNTGTKTTNEWRQRFGFVHNQLTSHDDILRLDYITGGFDQSHALIGSYEFPLISDSLRLRPYLQYAKFDASDVGLSGLNFSGETWVVGAEAIWNIWQHREAFLDLVGGAKYQNVEVINDTTGGSGEDAFAIPYIGLRFDRSTEATSTNAELIMEFQVPDLAGTDSAEIQNLGRLEVDEAWEVLKFSGEQSFYIEPLLNPRGWRGEEGGELGVQTLAHEFAVSARGQYAFGDRLIANEEEVAGGFFSVRGYPESLVAGDSVVIGTLEYRFHFPRVFGVSEPGKFRGRDVHIFGSDFRYAPQQPFGRADWDLVFKGFVDAAATKNNDQLVGETDQTLIGAGVGMEFQWKRNVSMRLDWGFALKDADTDSEEVNAGDNRLHFSLTLLY